VIVSLLYKFAPEPDGYRWTVELAVRGVLTVYQGRAGSLQDAWPQAREVAEKLWEREVPNESKEA